MSDIKTKPTTISAETFLAGLQDEQQRKDSQALIAMMSEVTGKPPVMWGPSIIGFDTYHYKYASGHEGDMAATGFAPRKGQLVIYIMDTLGPDETELFDKLGKYTSSRACLYVKRLSDINMDVLKELTKRSYAAVKKQWG